MDLANCDFCAEPVELTKTGRPRRFCSNACRQRSYRRRRELEALERESVPAGLRDRNRWVLHRDKRPVALGGWWSSVNDETTYMQYSEARDALNREDVDANGLGFVLNGDGVICVDIDDCVKGGEPTVEAREFLDAIGRTYVEYSPSGRGLHVWGFAFMDKGRVFKGRHLKVEVYPNKRFITVTGRPYRDGELGRLDLDAALPLVA